MKQTCHKQTVCINQHPRDLAKLILKLRWIGMEEEAHHLQVAVCSLPPHERYAVLAGGGPPEKVFRLGAVLLQSFNSNQP